MTQINLSWATCPKCHQHMRLILVKGERGLTGMPILDDHEDIAVDLEVERGDQYRRVFRLLAAFTIEELRQLITEIEGVRWKHEGHPS